METKLQAKITSEFLLLASENPGTDITQLSSIVAEKYNLKVNVVKYNIREVTQRNEFCININNNRKSCYFFPEPPSFNLPTSICPIPLGSNIPIMIKVLDELISMKIKEGKGSITSISSSDMASIAEEINEQVKRCIKINKNNKRGPEVFGFMDFIFSNSSISFSKIKGRRGSEYVFIVEIDSLKRLNKEKMKEIIIGGLKR